MTIPSQAQLVRQSTEKDLLAATFMKYAEELDRVFSATLAQPETVDTFWKGPAAGRFVTETMRLASEIRVLRESCVSTADRLRRQAELTRAEAAQMPI